jgi:hypothetical protein
MPSRSNPDPDSQLLIPRGIERTSVTAPPPDYRPVPIEADSLELRRAARQTDHGCAATVRHTRRRKPYGAEEPSRSEMVKGMMPISPALLSKIQIPI